MRFCLIWGRCIALGLLLLFFTVSAPAASSVKSQAYVIVIKGGIGPAVSEYVVDGIARAEKNKAALIILQMDTPGGLSSSMRTIIKRMLASRVAVNPFLNQQHRAYRKCGYSAKA